MAAYKPGKTSVHIAAGQSAEDAEVIKLCDEHASLVGLPLGAATKKLLLEVTPPRIAELKGQVKAQAV